MNVPGLYVVCNSDTIASTHSDVHDRHGTQPDSVSSTSKLISHSIQQKNKTFACGVFSMALTPPFARKTQQRKTFLFNFGTLSLHPAIISPCG